MQHDDYYRRLRDKFRRWLRTETGKTHRWAEYLLFAPDLFHLLCKLVVDPEVPVGDKGKLAAAIVYFVSPIDLVPEAIVGPAGYIDDIALAAYVLSRIVCKTDSVIIRRHWAGDGDVLALIQRILTAADRMIGSGLWKRLVGMIK